jgi:hypothetical protein
MIQHLIHEHSRSYKLLPSILLIKDLGQQKLMYLIYNMDQIHQLLLTHFL